MLLEGSEKNVLSFLNSYVLTDLGLQLSSGEAALPEHFRPRPYRLRRSSMTGGDRRRLAPPPGTGREQVGSEVSTAEVLWLVNLMLPEAMPGWSTSITDVQSLNQSSKRPDL